MILYWTKSKIRKPVSGREVLGLTNHGPVIATYWKDGKQWTYSDVNGTNYASENDIIQWMKIP